MNSLVVVLILVVYVGSCVVPGVGAGFLAQRGRWQFLIGILSIPVIAFVWPIAIFILLDISGQRHLAKFPDDDAPGMAMASFVMAVVPILVISGLLLAIIGFAFGYSRTGRNTERLTAARD